MSIKELQSNPDDYVNRTQMHDRNRGHILSPVHTVAKTLIEQGRNGLVVLSKKLQDNSNSALFPSQDIINRLSTTDREIYGTSHVAIIFGASIIAIEQTLINGRFDPREFVGEYNAALMGTAFPKAKITHEGDGAMEMDQLKEMYALSKQDPTFGVFFTPKGIQHLPEGIRYVLEISGVHSQWKFTS